MPFSFAPVALAPTPTQKPLFSKTIKDKNGADVIAACPNAIRGLVALMDLHAVNGGAACHWGGPAGFAEIFSAAHTYMFRDTSKKWYEQVNFVNDAGHCENGIYATRALFGFGGTTPQDLWGFRSIHSPLTGHGEAHINPTGVLISNGPLGSGLGQAEGLALADKQLGNSRTTLCMISDGACMEGEAKEALASIPGLASKGKLNPFVLVVSDNNTKLSGRIDSQCFSMTPTFNSLSTLGWEVVNVPNGNNLQEVYTSLEKAWDLAATNPSKPVVLWCKTIKGYGVKSTVESSSGAHGYPLKKNDPKIIEFINEIFNQSPPQAFSSWAKELFDIGEVARAKAAAASTSATPAAKPVKEKVQVGVARALIKAAKDGLPVYSLTADLPGSTGLAAFQKEFPQFSQDIGIAESNMVSVASGMAALGYIPVVDTFAQFGVTKGNLPLVMASLSNCPIVAVYSHTGFQDAADGASHQATTYIAATAAIPGVDVVCVSCSKDAEEYVYQGIKNIHTQRLAGKHPHSLVVFLGREDFAPENVIGAEYVFGKAQVLKTGTDGVIVACGPTVSEALSAAKTLEEKGKSFAVVNHAFVNNTDVSLIADLVNKATGRLITVEDHQIIGGMGSLLAHALVQKGVALKLTSLGIQGDRKSVV